MGRLQAEVARLRGECRRLAWENGRLHGELSAFDLDFFEEIEDLKYRHAEAHKRLAAAEARAVAAERRVGGGVGGEGLI